MGEVAAAGGKAAVRLHLLVGGIERRVGDEGPEIDVEGLVLAAFDEGKRFIDEGGRRFRAEGEINFVPAGSVRIESAGDVEAVVSRRRSTVAAAEMPLAKVGGRVAGLLQKLCDVRHGRVEPVGHVAGGVLLVSREMAVDAVPGRVLACHEGAAAR